MTAAIQGVPTDVTDSPRGLEKPVTSESLSGPTQAGSKG